MESAATNTAAAAAASTHTTKAIASRAALAEPPSSSPPTTTATTTSTQAVKTNLPTTSDEQSSKSSNTSNLNGAGGTVVIPPTNLEAPTSDQDPGKSANNNGLAAKPATAGLTTSGGRSVTTTTSANNSSSQDNARGNQSNNNINTSAATHTTNTPTSNGILKDSTRTNNGDILSKTNLYIRGLQPNTSDQNLYDLCSRFGQILSTKAIVDKASGCCRGYGFVEFTSPDAAEQAVSELTKSGVQAQMAKITTMYSSHHNNHQNHHHNHQHHHQHHNNHQNHSSSNHHNGHSGGGGSNGKSSNSNHNNNNAVQQHNQNTSSNSDADPTNLYIANLPPNMSEQELENLLSSYGPVVSTRILRDQDNIPRGVGFARMESRDKCEQIIEQLNGRPYKGWKEPLLVKFADSGIKKRNHLHHHNNHHQYNHQHHNNNLQHHKLHQDDSRWRDGNSSSDLLSVPNFDRQGNISHSNHLTDLAMIGTLGYPRLTPGYPPTLGPGATYPGPLGPTSSQWIHPGTQPYVISQQMIQAGLDPSNQTAALHYGHIPQLTSQMQGLQIAHTGAPVGGYHLPTQHQWSAMWTHTIPQQPPLPPPQSTIRHTGAMQQAQSQQQSSQKMPMQHQQQQPPPPNSQQQPLAPTDHKLQVPMPM